MTRTRPLPSTTPDRWRHELGIPFALGAVTATTIAALALAATWATRTIRQALDQVVG